MEPKQLGQFILDKLLLVPYYYTAEESELSVAIGLFALLLSFFALRRMVSQTRARILLSAAVAAFCFILYHLYLKDTGGIFLVQTACRTLFFAAVGYLVPYKEDTDGQAEEN